MQKRIIINASELETRVALVEGNALAELHVESGAGRSIVGNIYKGRVLRVLPGMQAAFVDIGLEKAAFMHVSDFWRAPAEGQDGVDVELPEVGSIQEELTLEPSLAAYVDELDTTTPEPAMNPDEVEIFSPTETAAEDRPDARSDAPTADGTEDAVSDDGAAAASGSSDNEKPLARAHTSDEDGDEERESGPRLTIEEALTKGQEILVQVSKEPIGTKGARITSHISLPGRYVVYMPTTDHIGVSRRIEEEKERKRLRDIVASGRPEGSGGFIVRTACEGVSKREILADMRFLSKLWASILKKGNSSPAPTQLHEDLDIVLRSVRDLFTSDVAQAVVDRKSDYDRVIDFVDSVLQPRLKSRVEYYDGAAPIFDRFGLETQVSRALERRVWLKSGGYLVFDQTEALTTIDVNTGRFVGKKTQEETVLKTNLEAARVAIDQLRLRNIGGIIIIDFIDMEKLANRKKVSEALAEAVKRDKARTNILRISELGLVQMTRKRTRDNLRQLMTAPCPTCNGDGRLRSVDTLAAEALRALRRAAATSPDAATMALRLPPDVAAALRGPRRAGVEEIETSLAMQVNLQADPRLHLGQCEVQILLRRAAPAVAPTEQPETPEPALAEPAPRQS